VTVRARTLLPYLLAFALGLGAAGLAACGSSGSSRALIPSADAGPLKADFDAIASAVDAGDCQATDRALARAQNDLDGLPTGVSVRLKNRLQAGLDRLRRQAPTECRAAQTQTQTTPSVTTDTVTTVTETTPTTTATTPTTTVPTTTATTPTTTTPPTTTTGGGTGGVGTP
jgi:hypothetical protein